MAEAVRGSSTCPICSLDKPHNHSGEEVGQYHARLVAEGLAQGTSLRRERGGEADRSEHSDTLADRERQTYGAGANAAPSDVAPYAPRVMAEQGKADAPAFDPDTGNYPLKHIAITICQACLDGIGEGCHTPGCSLFLHRVDLPIAPEVYTVLPLVNVDTPAPAAPPDDLDPARRAQGAAGITVAREVFEGDPNDGDLSPEQIQTWLQRCKEQRPEHDYHDQLLFAWLEAGQPDEGAFRAGIKAGEKITALRTNEALQRECEELRAGQGWQPIETAPDGYSRANADCCPASEMVWVVTPKNLSPILVVPDGKSWRLKKQHFTSLDTPTLWHAQIVPAPPATPAPGAPL